MLRIYLLRIAGETVAARFAVAHAGRLWDLKIGDDETWRACSPGILMTQETLRHAVQEGLVAHEFLGMAAEWERIWPGEARRFRTLRYYPAALGSLAALGAEAGRLARRRAARALPRLRQRLGRVMRRRG